MRNKVFKAEQFEADSIGSGLYLGTIVKIVDGSWIVGRRGNRYVATFIWLLPILDVRTISTRSLILINRSPRRKVIHSRRSLSTILRYVPLTRVRFISVITAIFLLLLTGTTMVMGNLLYDLQGRTSTELRAKCLPGINTLIWKLRIICVERNINLKN